jgi:hypothetical protein
MRARLRIALTITAIVLLAACGSSSSKGSKSGNNATTNTNGSNKSFHVQTADGQVSLSLNGQLPPNWPTAFPVPSGAKTAGSGSLVGGETGILVGVYTTSQAPADVYQFYKTNPSLTIGTSRSAGARSTYVGSLELKGGYDGYITIISLNGSTAIVITLRTSSTTTTTY